VYTRVIRSTDVTATNASAESTVYVARRLRSTRRRRIAMELLLPPLVATVLAALIAVLHDPREIPTIPWSGFLGGVLAVLVVAYIVASIPSALFTIVMEVAFAKGLSPGSWAAVALAAGLGLLSGAGIVRAGARRAHRAAAGHELHR